MYHTKLAHISVESERTHANEATLWDDVTGATVEANILLARCHNLLNHRRYDGRISGRSLFCEHRRVDRVRCSGLEQNRCSRLWCAYACHEFFVDFLKEMFFIFVQGATEENVRKKYFYKAVVRFWSSKNNSKSFSNKFANHMVCVKKTPKNQIKKLFKFYF